MAVDLRSITGDARKIGASEDGEKTFYEANLDTPEGRVACVFSYSASEGVGNVRFMDQSGVRTRDSYPVPREFSNMLSNVVEEIGSRMEGVVTHNYTSNAMAALLREMAQK